MKKMNLVFLLTLTLVSHSLIFNTATHAAEDSRSWTALGFREPDGPPISQLLAEFRKSLAMQIDYSQSIQVRSESETKALLGLSSQSAAVLVGRVRNAERSYQKYALDVARKDFEAVLQELPFAGGEPGVWEAAKIAHLLLAMIHLEEQNGQEEAKARSQLDAILRFESEFAASDAPDDPRIRKLLHQSREQLANLRKGTLRVTCKPGCRDGFVWVNAAPSERVDRSPISLPVGTYQVRVTDRVNSPFLKSFTRKVVITPGTETRLEVDLEAEGAADTEGGPAFLVARQTTPRVRAVQAISNTLKSGRLAILWLEGDYPRQELHMAVVDGASAKVERRAFVTLKPESNSSLVCEDLARYAISGIANRNVIVTNPVLSPKEELEIPSSGNVSRILNPAAWTVTGGALALGTAGIVVAATKASGNRSKVDTGLLIGAGACAATAIVLHIADWMASRPSTPQSPSRADIPGTPSLPDTPQAPSSPKLPDTPNAPEMPSAPKLPGLQVSPLGISFTF